MNQEPFVSTKEYDYNQSHQDKISIIASRSFLVVFVGLIITTVCAYFTVSIPSLMEGLLTGYTIAFICIFEMIAVVASTYAIRKNYLKLAVGLFGAYTILNGITLSVIFLIYDLGKVQEAFLLTTILFGVISAYGYFSKRDLSSIGAICGMALIGAIIVSLANIFFLHSTGIDILMDYLVVLIFVGLTAYDMYKMKQLALSSGAEDINRIALYTGMQLYLDFINLFLRLVRILSRKR